MSKKNVHVKLKS